MRFKAPLVGADQAAWPCNRQQAPAGLSSEHMFARTLDPKPQTVTTALTRQGLLRPMHGRWADAGVLRSPASGLRVGRLGRGRSCASPTTCAALWAGSSGSWSQVWTLFFFFFFFWAFWLCCSHGRHSHGCHHGTAVSGAFYFVCLAVDVVVPRCAVRSQSCGWNSAWVLSTLMVITPPSLAPNPQISFQICPSVHGLAHLETGLASRPEQTLGHLCSTKHPFPSMRSSPTSLL